MKGFPASAAVFAIALSLSAPQFLVAAKDESALETARKIQDSFASVAEKAFPSVVIVKVKYAAAEPSARAGSRRVPPRMPRQQRGQDEQPQEGGPLGSGFIIREDGYILTNHHVAGEAAELAVTLHDGRELPAKLVGSDWKTDLAVLKVDAKGGLPALKFADTGKVKVGHWAIAIGAPYSFGYTMTTGIVSQKDRSVGLNLYEDYIQTDASINPGNSGGPLLNLDGEVIGVNDFILAGGAGGMVGNTGMAFAIDGALASSIAESIIKFGEVVRPWLGVSMQQLDDSLKRQFKTEKGVLVREVVSGDPADKGGVEPGDIIVKIGSNEVKTPKDVQFGILKYKPGDKIALTVMRDGKEKALEVLAGRQRKDTLANAEMPQPASTAQSMQDGTFAEFGLSLSERGGQVFISGVEPGTQAALARLRPGMRVHAVNRMRVDSVQEAEKAASTSERRLLLYVDDGQAKYFIALAR